MNPRDNKIPVIYEPGNSWMEIDIIEFSRWPLNQTY